MRHPDDDVLLAYIRQQTICWSGDIQHHITLCQVCQSRCIQLRETSILIERWSDSLSAHTSYTASLLSERVLQRIQRPAPRSTPLFTWGSLLSSWRLASLPLALALLILFTVGVMALARQLSSSYLIGTSQLPAQTLATTYVTGKITSPPTPTSLLSTESEVIGTAPYIRLCSNAQDVAKQQLRVCGYNFTPGSKVALILEIAGSGPKMRPTVSVNASGRMEDAFSVSSCRAVPRAIVAFNPEQRAETSQVLEDIPYPDYCFH